MFWRVALAVGRAQDRLAQRRIAALGTWAWPFWLLAWMPPRLLFLWLFDLACMSKKKYRKDPICRA